MVLFIKIYNILQAATGEIITAEELGGATLHCR